VSARVRGRHAHRRTGRDASREAEIVPLMEDRAAHTETSPRLTGGDVDADWHAAWDAGDEAVGGSVATPDQSVVDELGEALGVARLAATLAPLGRAALGARLTVSDQNGPKGGVAIRCTIDAQVARWAPIHADARATSARAALSEALDRFERLVRRAARMARD